MTAHAHDCTLLSCPLLTPSSHLAAAGSQQWPVQHAHCALHYLALPGLRHLHCPPPLHYHAHTAMCTEKPACRPIFTAPGKSLSTLLSCALLKALQRKEARRDLEHGAVQLQQLAPSHCLPMPCPGNIAVPCQGPSLPCTPLTGALQRLPPHPATTCTAPACQHCGTEPCSRHWSVQNCISNL